MPREFWTIRTGPYVHTIPVRPGDKVDEDYLLHFMRTEMERLENGRNGHVEVTSVTKADPDFGG
ncbi:MAG TPA: hypothetical protein VMU89_14935 [Thermomicrobiaceae bacterium]|nr:hypothetical protein [Thermomicrobiaceae bacterium]